MVRSPIRTILRPTSRSQGGPAAWAGKLPWIRGGSLEKHETVRSLRPKLRFLVWSSFSSPSLYHASPIAGELEGPRGMAAESAHPWNLRTPTVSRMQANVRLSPEAMINAVFGVLTAA